MKGIDMKTFNHPTQNLYGKRLLLLGGVNHAIEIIKAAHELGVLVYVTDYNKGTPAKVAADKSFTVSTVDIDALEVLCNEEGIDGVITGFIDSMLPYAQELCQRMKYPFWATPEQLNICINKDKFKEACRRYGVPVIRDYDITDEYGNLIPSKLDSVQYPVVVKPVDNSGSRGVFICRNEEELIERYNEALVHSKSKKVLCEQYVEGQHVNMYYTLSKGEIYLSAMADRYVDYLDNGSAPLPAKLVHPSQYLDEYLKETNDIIKNFFRSIGMKDGLAFVQGFRCNDGSFVIYEMGYRLNGGGTYALIDACEGFDQLKSLITFCLTGEMGYESELECSTPQFKQKAVNYVISAPRGNIIRISGLEEIKDIPEMKRIIQVRFDGDKVSGQGGSSQIIAYALFTAESNEEIDAVIRKINETVNIEVAKQELCKNQTVGSLLISAEDQRNIFFDGYNDAITVVEDALKKRVLGEIVLPDKISVIFDEATQNRINCMPSALLKDKLYGVKWVAVFPENPKEGYRNVTGTIILSELEHGHTISVMDAGYLTEIRTAAVGATAAKYLARENSEVIGFIGAGQQARRHLDLVKIVRPGLRKCFVSSRTNATVEAFIKEEQELHPDMEFIACGNDYEAAVKDADIIVTAISGQADILKAKWIKKGSFYIHVAGWEDEYAVPKSAAKIICDDWECIKHRTQTISRMYKDGLLNDEDIYGNLEEVITGTKQARENDEEFIYFCSVGLAFIDISFAKYVYYKCLERGLGTKFSFE